MPDRVKVSTSVPKAYRHVGMQVDEDQDPESIRDSFVRAAEKDIRNCGQSGNELIRQAVSRLRPISEGSLLPGIVNWGEEHAHLEELALSIRGDRLHRDLAVEAVRQVMLRMERGDKMENLTTEIWRERLVAIFEANVAEGRVGVNNPHISDSKRQQCIGEVRTSLRESPVSQLRHSKASATEDWLDVDLSKL